MDPVKLPQKDMFFASLTDFVAYVDGLPVHGPDKAEFSGGTFEEAKSLALTGWSDGARMAAELATKIAERVVANPATRMRQTVEYDVVGAAFDPGAVNLGIPEAWASFQPIEEEKKSIRILFNVDVSGAVPNSAIQARGIAVCALAMTLQAKGYAVTLDIGQVTALAQGGVESILVRAADGSTGSPLDLDRIVYMAAHPTFFRLLCAYTTQGFRGDSARTRWGSARPAEIAKHDAQLYIGKASMTDYNRWQGANAERWVLDEYMRQTTEVA